MAPLDIRQRRTLVDQTAAATDRRFLTWAATKKLARLAAVRGVIFASRRWLAAFLGVSVRTLARIITDLRQARVFVVMATRGAGGGTVMLPAWGHDVDEATAARAILAQLGQPVTVPGRSGTFRTTAMILGRMISEVLPPKALEILRRVALAADRMCHPGRIEPESSPTSNIFKNRLIGTNDSDKRPADPRENASTVEPDRPVPTTRPSPISMLVTLLRRPPEPPRAAPPSPGRAELLASAHRLGIPRRER